MDGCEAEVQKLAEKDNIEVCVCVCVRCVSE